MLASRRDSASHAASSRSKTAASERFPLDYYYFTPPWSPPGHEPDVPSDVPSSPPEHSPDAPLGLSDSDDSDHEDVKVHKRRKSKPTSEPAHPAEPTQTPSPPPTPIHLPPPVPAAAMDVPPLEYSPNLPPLIGVTPPLRIRKKTTTPPASTHSGSDSDSSETEAVVPQTPPITQGAITEEPSPMHVEEPTPTSQPVTCLGPLPVPRFALGELPPPPKSRDNSQVIPPRFPRRRDPTRILPWAQAASTPVPEFKSRPPPQQSLGGVATVLLPQPKPSTSSGVKDVVALDSSEVKDAPASKEMARNLKFLQEADSKDLIEVSHERPVSLLPSRELHEIAEVEEPSPSPTASEASQPDSANSKESEQADKESVKFVPLPDVPTVSPLDVTVQQPSPSPVRAPTRALPTPPSPSTPSTADTPTQPTNSLAASWLPTPPPVAKLAAIDKDLPPSPVPSVKRTHQRSGSSSSSCSADTRRHARNLSSGSLPDVTFSARHSRKGSASSSTGSMTENIFPTVTQKLKSPFRNVPSATVPPPTSSSKAAAILGIDAPEPPLSFSRLLKRRQATHDVHNVLSGDQASGQVKPGQSSASAPTTTLDKEADSATKEPGHQWPLASRTEDADEDPFANPWSDQADGDRPRPPAKAVDSKTPSEPKPSKLPELPSVSDDADSNNRRSASPPPRSRAPSREEATRPAEFRYSRQHPFAIAQPVPLRAPRNVAFLPSEAPSAPASRPNSDYSSSSSTSEPEQTAVTAEDFMEVLQLPDTPLPIKPDTGTPQAEDKNSQLAPLPAVPSRAVSPSAGATHSGRSTPSRSDSLTRPSRATPSPSPSIASESHVGLAPGQRLVRPLPLKGFTNLTPPTLPVPPEPEDEGESWFDHEPITPTPQGLVGRSKTWMRKIRH